MGHFTLGLSCNAGYNTMVSSKLLRMITTRTAAEKQVAYSLPLWALPTAVSLDAPLVAVAWQGLFAKTFGLVLDPNEIFLLFASVWLIYTADRLLDSLKLEPRKIHSYRHAFVYHHRRSLSLVWLVVLALVAIFSWLELGPYLFKLGLLVLGLCLLYGLGIHRFKAYFGSSKELQIGAVFALGTLVVFLPQLSLQQLWLGWLCFALLCSFNCYLIAVAEKALDQAQNDPSLAQQFAGLEPLLKFVLPAFGLIFALLAFYLRTPLYLLMALSSLALAFLLLYKAQLGNELVRVLADAVLLSPFILLIH